MQASQAMTLILGRCRSGAGREAIVLSRLHFDRLYLASSIQILGYFCFQTERRGYQSCMIVECIPLLLEFDPSLMEEVVQVDLSLDRHKQQQIHPMYVDQLHFHLQQKTVRRNGQSCQVVCSAIVNGRRQIFRQWEMTHNKYESQCCNDIYNMMRVGEEQKQSLVVSPKGSAIEMGSSMQGILRYLSIIIILLLTVGNYLQSKDVKNISNTLKIHLQADPMAYRQYVNRTLSQYHLRMTVLEKEMQVYKKAIQFDLIAQMEFLNRTISNTTKLINQLDQSVATLETVNQYTQFQQRRNKTMKIIQSNQTVQSFGKEYAKYTNQFQLSLQNIENPYYDLAKRYNHTEEMRQLVQNEYQNYQSKYNIDKYNYEISMCVIVPTRNNVFENRYIYNIQSILNQNYSNYLVVVIDDNSDDKTGLLIERYLRRKNVSPRKVVVVKKDRREGSLANIYFAIHNYCKDYTVTLQVDGDDELIGSYVFKLFNAIYQSKNPGFAYSNHVYYAQDEEYISKGYSEAYSKLSIEKQNYRKIIQRFGHLRSFRTELFFKINEQDLRDAQGQFYMAAGDQAYIFPMLQMSCRNIEYIDEATYLYNGQTGNNVRKAFKQTQQKNAIFIRLLKKYTCLPVYENPLPQIG